MFYGFNVTFQPGPIPASIRHAKAIGNAPDDQSAFVLAIPGDVTQSTARNVGHCLGDFVWPLYARLAQLRMLSIHNVFLYHPPASWGQPASQAHPIIAAPFLQALTTVPLRRLVDNETGPVRFHLIHAGRSTPFVKSGKSPFPSGILASLVRDHAYRVIGLPRPLPPNKRPKIAVRSKPSRHRILNSQHLADHLRKRYRRADVVLFAAEQFKRDSFEELRFMSSLDVYITPEGGGSFSLVYMRDGATAILVNPCWPGTERIPPSNGAQEHNETGGVIHCVRVENFIWDRLPYVRKLYYAPLQATPTSAGLVSDAQRRHPYFSQFDYSYPVNLDHMDVLVDAALRQSGFPEHAIGAGDISSLSRHHRGKS